MGKKLDTSATVADLDTTEEVIVDGCRRAVLLKSYPGITVDPEKLSAATSAARKSDRPGYKGVYHLLRAVFDAQEIAASKGQGLSSKASTEGDCRLPLDKTKVSCIKDYARKWCRKHGFTEPKTSELNKAITEQISFTRKQMKKQPQ